MILSSVLPGLRDVRLPLSVGLTWLAVCWFLFRERLPESDSRDGVVGGAYQLVDLLGPTASLSVLVFVGYVLGALVTFNVLREVPLSLLLRGTAPFDRSGLVRGAFKPIDEGRVQQLRSMIGARLDELSSPEAKVTLEERYGFADDTDQRLTDVVLDRLVREQSPIADGLSLSQPERFDKFDRLQSEAQFRQAISFPLAALTITLAFVSGNALICLALLPVVALWLQGVRRSQGARSILFSNVVDGTQESDVLADLQKLR